MPDLPYPERWQQSSGRGSETGVGGCDLGAARRRATECGIPSSGESHENGEEMLFFTHRRTSRIPVFFDLYPRGSKRACRLRVLGAGDDTVAEEPCAAFNFLFVEKGRLQRRMFTSFRLYRFPSTLSKVMSVGL
ncbi:hypothetical protein SKAU_G00318800 [Synaphobranchus kaupii]|uniref:Uncharacterized protein n=1 Tax=Synaphobranchus kaupii TaxID=118154 RepID=A0A9Q1ET64_SYNKA|nr:hypothetical protein SKAU_G00318800 [Synaphobranchus kaupii]